MNRPRSGRKSAWLMLVLAVALVPGTSGHAGMPGGRDAFAGGTSATLEDVVLRSDELAERIDHWIGAGWAAAGVEPSQPAGDAEFLRRIYLDITGVIPPASEVRDFLDDTSPGKRPAMVERLLASHGYANRMAALWRDLLIPEAESNRNLMYYEGEFDAWLRKQFSEGTSFDAIVRELLTTPIDGSAGPFARQGGNDDRPPTPFAFYAAKDGKPEELAAATTRVFLGIRLECAQCHDHPFSDWSRDEFWEMAAFFAGVNNPNPGNGFFQGNETFDTRKLKIPDTDRLVKARFLDGTEPTFAWRVSAREPLADWVASADNPYFAQAAANRVWSQFFGIGLVDPVDDMGSINAPSHPELLDTMARQLVLHDFDLVYLIRAITSSRAYGLSSAGYSPGQDEPSLYARFPVRTLSAQQLYASFVQATGIDREEALPPGLVSDSPRTRFLERFAGISGERPTEVQRSILQALTLMNGRLTSDATSLTDRAGTLPALAGADFLDVPSKIEALYLAALSRPPSVEERERLTTYLDRTASAAARGTPSPTCSGPCSTASSSA